MLTLLYTTAFSVTDDEVKISRYFDESITVMADDGFEAKLLTLNPNYNKQYFHLLLNPSETIKSQYNTHHLICHDNQHILLEILFAVDIHDTDYDFEFELLKVKDYKYVTAYKLAYSYLKDGVRIESVNQTLVWIDKQEGKYCGNLERPILYKYDKDYYLKKVKTDTGQEYYDHVKEIYLNEVEEYLNFYDRKLDDKNEYGFAVTAISPLFDVISLYDTEQYAQINKFIESIRAKQTANWYTYMTSHLLDIYTLPVSEVVACPSWDSEMQKIEHPNIEGELPKNDAELVLYLEWISVGYRYSGRYDDKEQVPLHDYFGTRLQFEVLSEGIKAVSAGADTEFDTEDDLVFIRPYVPVEVEEFEIDIDRFLEMMKLIHENNETDETIL